ncbi:hypothetical protein HPB49_002477 [Dermacentor silvarum]|uniref:Uncharacterized protein n=1 Tax=Dermacentor silvarum TaxID=543639 RepID=A0ACB8CD48_DERSI|nr:hypothetical protein HPB49_002477 [Dermacentor silvarum]
MPCTAANDASDDSGTPESSPDEQRPMDGSSSDCAADYSDDNVPSTCPNGDSHLESNSDGCLDSLAHERISDGEAWSLVESSDDEALDSDNDSVDESSRAPPYRDGEDEESTSSSSEDDRRGDLPCDSTVIPPFDDSQLLAKCIADFGTKTLPGSTTTIAVAIVLIMSFIAAHGLPWSAVDDLLKLVDALFGFQRCGLPQSKYLLRKLWSAKCAFSREVSLLLQPVCKLLHISSDKALLSCNAA